MKSLTNILARGGRGFTLTELLVVVTVIAILASVAFPTYMSVVDRSKSLAMNKAAMAVAGELEEVTLDHRPMIERYAMEMALAADYQRVGLHVFNRFRLDCEGELEFRPAEPAVARSSS